MKDNDGAIIYNVTVKVEQSIADKWLQWMKQEHIPETMKTNCFTGYKIARLLEIDDSEGPTFAVQYLSDSKADYNRFVEIHANEIMRKAFEKWNGAFVEFRSVMEVVK